ncbi:MAG: glutamine synthetase [Proteobacteria bacterium]|jgi:glutamine synthetase|nr:glutamine synthetase [Chloroflexota bacterium]MCP4830290.1 glutamine synthetase [Pseudomonadota bacterium]HJP08007.1 glutamine synthetase family protein [Arenicellales bacterium]|tara:strand:+ start:1696 stop:3027 length:1332 start_codon:yes stop_codon:yes gene_type:complete
MQVKKITEMIKSAGIDSIRIEFPDLYGICRGKLIPAGRLEAVVEEGLNFAQAAYIVDLSNDIAVAGGCGSDTGWSDMLLRPDLDTFAILPHQPDTARLIGNTYLGDSPHPVDPRGALKRILKKYEAKGLTAIAASELEFMIFHPTDPATSYNPATSCVYQVNPAVDKQGILRAIQNNSIDLGLNIMYLNHEYFPGQYEVNWHHEEALKMADQTFTFKYLCKELATLNNLKLTFMGRPVNEGGGNGYHTHISLAHAESNENAFYDPQAEDGISDLQRYFIGGQLAHARGMSALLAPTINSYKRFLPDSFAPYNIAWGGDNRTVYCRVPDDRGKGTRIENRAGCASANPYLVIAAILAAGLDGIENKIDPGPAADGDVYHDESGQYQQVPFYLRDAIAELKADTVLAEAFSPELIGAFVALKENEESRFKTTVTDWEFNEYAYHL